MLRLGSMTAQASLTFFADNWRYAKGTEDKAATAITAWMVRGTNYALMTATGLHAHPRNYANADVGVALVAADAEGNVLMSREAYGLGAFAADVSPARWGMSRNSMLPPDPWCWAGIYDNLVGQSIDVPAEVPWSCIKGMQCNPEAVLLHYVEPAIYIYNVIPSWLGKTRFRRNVGQGPQRGRE
jgi:hypothetical protein